MSIKTPSFSVVIPTYNREDLLRRAIRCVFDSARRGQESVEVLVVDDASPVQYLDRVKDEFPEIRTFCMNSNGGPGPARDRGIREASAEWTLCLDDDDILLPDAFVKIRQFIQFLADKQPSPVLQIAGSNASLGTQYARVGLEDFVNGSISGDWVPIVQTATFRQYGFSYPVTRVGGENLLWFRVAKEFGMPTLLEPICQVTDDASSRLTSVESQLANASLHAEVHEQTLKNFGVDILSISPTYYRKRVFGASVYHILAGNRKAARCVVSTYGGVPLLQQMALLVLSYLPATVVEPLFRFYRKGSAW